MIQTTRPSRTIHSTQISDHYHSNTLHHLYNSSYNKTNAENCAPNYSARKTSFPFTESTSFTRTIRCRRSLICSLTPDSYGTGRYMGPCTNPGADPMNITAPPIQYERATGPWEFTVQERCLRRLDR